MDTIKLAACVGFAWALFVGSAVIVATHSLAQAVNAGVWTFVIVTLAVTFILGLLSVASGN